LTGSARAGATAADRIATAAAAAAMGLFGIELSFMIKFIVKQIQPLVEQFIIKLAQPFG
jgi:hypothetical protein